MAIVLVVAGSVVPVVIVVPIVVVAIVGAVMGIFLLCGKGTMMLLLWTL